MVLSSGNRKVLKLLKKSIKIAAMEQLDTLIFDAIIKLGDKLEDNKKQRNGSKSHTLRGCSSGIASSYFLCPSKVWSMLHHGSV